MDHSITESKGRALIVAAGPLEEAFAYSYYKTENEKEPFRYVIAADKGLSFLHQHGIRPDYIIGDFDSLPGQERDAYFAQYVQDPSIVIRTYNPVKDDSDLEIALHLAAEELEADEILILGGLGGREDHTFSAVQCLGIPLKKDIPAFLCNDRNRIRLLGNLEKEPFGGPFSFTMEKSDQYGKYVSLIPLTTTVEGLTLKGFRYPLDHGRLTILNSLGVSNQVEEDTASISFESGILIMVESSDKPKKFL